MYARLAFAVAIHVDPEILVIDEALSVGDEAFQRKCFARIQQIRESGATVLFVSHSAGSVIELCDRAILLDQGEELLAGTPKLVVAKYQKLAYAAPEKVQIIRDEIKQLGQGGYVELPAVTDEVKSTPEADHAYDPFLLPQSTVTYASRGAVVSEARITDLSGKPCNVLTHGCTYCFRYNVTFEKTAFRIRFGMMIKTVTGVEIAGCASHGQSDSVEMIEKDRQIAVQFEFHNQLAPGTYFLNAGVLGRTEEEIEWLHRVLDAVMFRVVPDPDQLYTGMVDLLPENHCKLIDLSGARTMEIA
jgi:lipopolysaccharide transport system ATP-binding protein